MRTNIVLNDKLVKEAMKLSGLETKKAVVEESLKLFIALQRQKSTAAWFGKLRWQGDLHAMRSDR